MTSPTPSTSTTRFISPSDVQQMMQKNPCSVQIVDCRSFLNYNMERIIGSVNVYCPPLVKRRFQNCLPLNTMLSPEAKLTLCRQTVSAIVLHDQCTDEALYHLGQSDLPLILHSLEQFLGDRMYSVLAGGYCRFRQEYPDLCSSHTSLSGPLRHISRHNSSKISLTELASASQHAGLLSNTATSAPIQIGSSGKHKILSLTPVELLPYLYIGDASHSSRKELLQCFKITAILNVSTSCENHFPSDFRYKIIPVEDSSNANLLEWFQDAILFIETERRAGGKVLVHCHGGISRSATVCLAYLMYTRHLRLDDAFEFVKSRRHVISPNANFMMQLTQFETELRNLGFGRPAACLHNPNLNSESSFSSCPNIARFTVDEIEEEDDDDGDDEMLVLKDEAEDEEEEEEEESSSCSDSTPLVFGRSTSMGYFNKPLTSPS